MVESALPINRFVEEYGRHVEAQSAAIFVGAGLSMLSGLPSWSALVDRYRAELGIDPIDDLPLLVQYYQDAHPDGPDTVRNDIVTTFATPDIAPNVAHTRLLSLPVSDIWTSNYDGLIEAAALRAMLDVRVYAEDADLATSHVAMKRLYKLHGSVAGGTVSEKLVIARDDFEHYHVTHPRFWQLLEAHFLTRSFLFLGFSLTDPNIAHIFRLARIFTPQVQRPHYAVLAKPKPGRADPRLVALRRRDLARVGVRVVEIDEHREVETVLARLVARCRPTRAYLSGSVDDTDLQSALVNAVADELGRQLADQLDVRLMAGGVLGARVGYVVCERRRARGTYRPGDFLVIRRPRNEPMDPPNVRLGSVVFEGSEAEGLRSAAFQQVRALVVLRGGERTSAEITEAKELGMGIIALGATGGAARDEWERQRADPDSYRLGERRVDVGILERLGHTDPSVVATATVTLLRQALFLA